MACSRVVLPHVFRMNLFSLMNMLLSLKSNTSLNRLVNNGQDIPSDSERQSDIMPFTQMGTVQDPIKK